MLFEQGYYIEMVLTNDFVKMKMNRDEASNILNFP